MPTSYLVASNPEVLALLLQENGLVASPALYDAPASAHNTMTVDFAARPPGGTARSAALSCPGSAQSTLSRPAGASLTPSPRAARRSAGRRAGRRGLSANQVKTAEPELLMLLWSGFFLWFASFVP